MKTVFAPFRLSLFGGGADFPDYYQSNPCFGLGISLKQGATVTFNDRCFHEKNYRLVYNKIENTNTINDIQHPLIKQLFRYYSVKQGELHYTSDFPSRSGLGTSSAFVAALIKIFANTQGNQDHQSVDLGIFRGSVESPADKIAELSIYFERIILNEIGGVQDQILCTRPGMTEIHYRHDGWHVNSIKCSKSWSFIENHCCLVEIPNSHSTRINKTSSDIQRMNLDSGYRLKTYRDEVRKMSKLGIQAILEQNLDQFCYAITRISDKKNELEASDICGRTSQLQTQLKAEGALASRLIGAGGGGFLLVVGTEHFIKNFSQNSNSNVFPIEISTVGPTELRRA